MVSEPGCSGGGDGAPPEVRRRPSKADAGDCKEELRVGARARGELVATRLEAESGSAREQRRRRAEQGGSRAEGKRAPSKSGRGKAAPPSMADELTELQGMLERLRLEKVKAEEMARERDEVIRKKEEEIETKGKQQERLQAELKKMQRIKEFKPTMVCICVDLYLYFELLCN